MNLKMNHPIDSIYHLYTTYSPCQWGDDIYPLPPIRGTRKLPLNEVLRGSLAHWVSFQPATFKETNDLEYVIPGATG